MQRLQGGGGGQKEVKMELKGGGKEKKTRAVQKGLQATHAGIGAELQFQKLLKPIKQEPEDGLQQRWETQWQKFPKTVQAPYFPERCPQLLQPPPEESPKGFQASFPFLKGTAETKLRSREEVFSQKACRPCEKVPRSSVEVKDEIWGEDMDSLEEQSQHFHRFRYQEAEGPRNVCEQLWKLCHQWLKPERHTKEQILELVVLEQLLTILPEDIQGWVREGRPQTCAQAVTLAEDFLLNLQRRQQDLEPYEEVIVNSPKAELDPSDAEEPGNSTEVERGSDDEPPLFSDGERCRSHHSEGMEHGELTRMSSKNIGGQTNLHPCFASGGENEELNLHPENAQLVEFGDISPERGRGTFLQVPEVAGRPGSQERPRHPQGNSARKLPRKNVTCREIDSDRSPSQERVPEHLPQKAATGCVRKSGPRADLAQPAKAPSYECSYCGKRWPCQSQLRRHLKIHTGERPHKCTDCGKSFSNSSNLSQHKRVHTGERPYSCKDCGKSYRRRASLLQHERETCRKGNPLTAPAVGYILLGNCTLLCMKKSVQSGKNRVIAPKGAEVPLAAQPLNLAMGYSQEKSQGGS
ncbi:PREDICTED: zinc finger and SCAN domain-containing protein 16-like [Thamnophis sirtalis]|uniref:Zinc finger and SCAN domain-containing protein 16-like n=1 Tax=Thamnophis sirtalis TaxID=35019 RepID=A0A6I9XAE6_9SAUR|nr:PREDICTED: zinc finger and SCAN domain-containing protein 16-like [Thamnophis sirtalis]